MTPKQTLSLRAHLAMTLHEVRKAEPVNACLAEACEIAIRALDADMKDRCFLNMTLSQVDP